MIKAYQIAPEYQESSLYFEDDFLDDVEVYGNRDYTEHTSDTFRNIPGMLENIADELDDLRKGLKNYTDFQTILEAYTGRDDYTRAERLKWLGCVSRWTETDEETGVFVDVLTLLFRREYASATIRGCCQGDWNRVIYPAEYGREWLNSFEVEYFNTGTEWEIKEDDDDPGYHVYCTTYDPRKELAEVVGCKPEEIQLFEFDGWTRSPKYKEVL